MKTGDYILDLTEVEHQARAKKIGWKESMYTCWGLDVEMAEDHPYWSELPDHHKKKYEIVYGIYWEFYKNNAPKSER